MMRNLTHRLFCLVVIMNLMLWMVRDVSAQVQPTPPPSSGTISITSSVPPKSSSVVFDIGAETSDIYSQGSEIQYVISYGSNNDTSIPLTVQAEWGKGLVEGASEANVELANYIVGSASNGFDNTPGVVDTVHNTITWSITQLPGHTVDQTVSFSLRLNDSYTGNRVVRFPIKARILSPVGQPDKVTYSKYSYAPPPTVSVSSDNTPTPTEEVSTTPSLTTTPVEQVLAKDTIQQIFISSLGSISARIGVDTTKPISLLLRYGLTPNTLNNVIYLTSKDQKREFVLTNLKLGTSYYFQIQTNTDAVSDISSDIFTFTTSTAEPSLESWEPTSMTLSQNRSLLYSGPATDSNGTPTKDVVISKDSVFDLSFTIPNSVDLKLVEVLIRQTSVLGISTETANDLDNLQSTTTKMTRVGKDLFVGKLRTPVVSGQYEVVSRTEDAFGNITEKTIGSMRVVNPFSIVDGETGLPLKHVKITLQIYNESTHIYELLSNVSTSIPNPAYSNDKGIVDISLFPGKYQATLSEPGYDSQTITFEIGSEPSANLPLVQLVRNKQWVGGSIDYLSGNVSEHYDVIKELTLLLASSHDFYVLNIITSVASLSLATIVLLLIFQNPKFNPDVFLLNINTPSRRKKAGALARHFIIKTLRFLSAEILSINLLFGVLFFFYLGHLEGLLVLLMNISNIILRSLQVILIRKRLFQNKLHIK